MLYAIIILVCMAIISVGNILGQVTSWWHAIVLVISYTLAVIIVDGIFSTIVRRCLPNKWFTQDVKCFIVNKKECKFYEKLGIKKWKDKVLELGMFTSFRKNKIAEPNNNEYIARYIMEANYGIICHIACIIFGFLILFIYPKYCLTIALPVAIVNLVLNALPTMILRYNLPKLHTIYKYNEKHPKKVENVEEDGGEQKVS